MIAGEGDKTSMYNGRVGFSLPLDSSLAFVWRYNHTATGLPVKFVFPPPLPIVPIIDPNQQQRTDTLRNVYQLRQWYGPLRELDQRHRVGVVCLDSRTARTVRAESGLPVVCCARIGTLAPLQRRDDARPVRRRAVLAQLELAVEAADRDLDPDDAVQHRLHIGSGSACISHGAGSRASCRSDSRRTSASTLTAPYSPCVAR